MPRATTASLPLPPRSLFKIGTSTATTGVSADLSLEGLHAVVFDEAHYLYESERGHAWEETLVLLPPEVRCVLLTATLAAPGALNSWLADVRRVQCTLLSTSHRVVPLAHGVLDARSGEVMVTCDEATGFNAPLYNRWLRDRKGAAKEAEVLQKKVAAAGSSEARAAIVADARGADGVKPKARSFTFVLNTALRNLEKKELLPALFFVLSRKDCESHAASVDGTLLDSSDAASVNHILNFHLHPHAGVLEHLQQYHTLRGLLMRGLAYHHSGVLPMLKEVVEILFAKGFVRALFATETFAVGLNVST